MTTHAEHPHAWVLRAMADGTLAVTDLEARFVNWPEDDFVALVSWGAWIRCPEEWQVRRKQRYITINGYQVPGPVREPLMEGEEYWVVLLRRASHSIWSDHRLDHEWLRDGLIHRTKEAAELHREALLSFTRQKGGE